MIISILTTNETFWLPIYTLNDKCFLSPLYILLATLQLITYCLTAYIICRTCAIFLRIKIFHENMNILMAWFLFQWFEAIVAKLVILPYQMGLIVIGVERQKTFYSWWSEDAESIVNVEDKDEMWPLYVACCFLWHYIYSMIFAIVVVGFERICATIYIGDYESVPRRHIPLILILLTNSITIPYAYLLINNHISFTFASGQCFVNSAMVFFGYLLLWRVNVEMRNRLVSKRLGYKKDKYSLAKKFQIEENIRSLVVAKRLVIAAVIYLSVSLGMLFYFVFGSWQGFHTLFAYILDNIIFSAALVLSITLLFCSPRWRTKFVRGLPILKNYQKTENVNAREINKNCDSEVYFLQLKHAWI